MGCCNSSNSDKVFYTGPTLSCIGVETNDNLSIVLQKINEGVCNSGGGGGNQDLQSVIDNGGHVTSTINPNTYIDFLNDNIGISFTTADGEVGNPDNSSLFLQEPTNIVLQNKYFPSNYLSSLTLAGGKFTLVETLDTSSTVLVFEDHTEEGEVLLQLPAKTPGTYTLAVKEEQNLQGILTNNNISSGIDIRLIQPFVSSNGYSTLGSVGRLEVGNTDTTTNQTISSILTPLNLRFFTFGSLGNYRADIVPPSPIPYGSDLIFKLPNVSGTGTYTLAKESAISGTFTNPTSITVTNGIITAIS